MDRMHAHDDQALRLFLRRVWRDDIAPLLHGRQASRRRRSARTAGQLAAATGLLLDGVLGLRGKPFTRFLTVTGASIGAILPDVWDWDWLRLADPAQRAVVDRQVACRAAALPESDALELFGLTPSATREDLRHAWHAVSLQWHPDQARDDAARGEYHLRFLVYKTAYDRLVRAYDDGRLPLASPGTRTAAADARESGFSS